MNYLYDKDYVVCLYENDTYVYRYGLLKQFSSESIHFIIKNNCELIVRGINLVILKITKEEVLIRGKITSIEKNEKNE